MHVSSFILTLSSYITYRGAALSELHHQRSRLRHSRTREPRLSALRHSSSASSRKKGCSRPSDTHRYARQSSPSRLQRVTRAGMMRDPGPHSANRRSHCASCAAAGARPQHTACQEAWASAHTRAAEWPAALPRSRL